MIWASSWAKLFACRVGEWPEFRITNLTSRCESVTADQLSRSVTVSCLRLLARRPGTSCGVSSRTPRCSAKVRGANGSVIGTPRACRYSGDDDTAKGRPTDGSKLPAVVTIKIDREEKVVPPDLLKDGKLTGLEIRHLGGVDKDRDLFEVVPGGSDRKIENGDEVEIRDGMRFFSAPATINPGRERRAGGGPTSTRRARSQTGLEASDVAG